MAGKTVVVNVRGMDRAGYLIGEVMPSSGSGILGSELIMTGCVWWNKNQAPKERTYKAAEFVARIKKVINLN